MNNESVGFNWEPVLRFALNYYREYGIKCRVKRNKFGVWRAWPMTKV